MNPDDQKPGHPPATDNYTPPAMGQYQPQPHDELEREMQNAAAEVPKPHFYVDEKIQKKKQQARMFMIVAIGFAILFVIGLIVIATSFGEDEDVPLESSLSVDEELKQDASSLGESILNYVDATGEPFEITPENAAELSAYLPTPFTDPRTDNLYDIVTSLPTSGEIQYVLGGTCNNDDSISQSGDDNNFAIRVLLQEEQRLHCIDRAEVQPIDVPSPS